MDYDPLALEYAAHRTHGRAVLDALVAGGRVGPESRVLEVGCGTGNYIAALHEATGASCFGLDPSAEMLAIAGGQAAGIELLAGSAGSLPFPDGKFDLAFSVDVIHHVSDRPAAIAEALRVLRPGGRICIVTENEEGIRGRLHSRYFPETVEVELARYPRVAELRTAMESAGFLELEEERVVSSYDVPDSGPYRARALSSLHLISEEAYRRGLARLERDLPLTGIANQLLLWGGKP